MTGGVDTRQEDARQGVHDRQVSPWSVGDDTTRRRRRRLLWGSGTAFAGVTVVFGFPTGRDVIIGWLLVFLLAICGGDLRVWWRAVLRDWLAFVVMLFAYDLLRGQADRLGGRLAGGRLLSDGQGHLLHAFVTPQRDADRFLFGGHVPTVWLQHHLYDPSRVHWYDVAIIPVYMSHFVVPTAVAGVLWARSYPAFRRYLASFVVLTGLTLLTYTLFPAVPPWMAGLNGYLPPGVGRVVSHTLLRTGITTVQSAVEHGEAYANPVAAIPSLHSAVPMLLLLMFWRAAGRARRTLLVAYVLAMTFTLVYGGEHYISDVLLGWLYAGTSLYAVDRWRARPRSGRGRADAGCAPP